MLRRDDELRLSKVIQAKYAECPDDYGWKEAVTEEVQRQVVTESGFAQNIRAGLDLLRSATALFPQDPEIKNAAHYLRHNILEACPLAIGSQLPAIQLHDIDSGSTVCLRELCSGDPAVIVASSYT